MWWLSTKAALHTSGHPVHDTACAISCGLLCVHCTHKRKLALAHQLTSLFLRLLPPAAGYEPDEATVALANAAGISSITVTNDRNAVKGADVIYTDVWASMGQKDTLEKKLRDFGPYQVRCGVMLCGSLLHGVTG
jgi:hypothetical protein